MVKIKDERYTALKLYIEAGKGESLRDVFKIVPPTSVANDSGINYSRLKRKMANPDKFSVKEIRTLADLFGVDDRQVYALIHGLFTKMKKPQ